MNKRVLEVVVKVKDEASKGLDKFASKLGLSKTALAGLAAGATVVVAVLKKMYEAVSAAVREVTALGDSFDKMSKRTGESVDVLTRWTYSAELAGGSARDIEIAFKKLSKSMYDAQQGLSTATRAFDKLGIVVTDSNGNLRNTNDVMLDLAEAFQHSTNRTETMAVAQDVLGRGALQMVAVLEQGRKALSEQGDEYDRIHGSMSDVALKSAEMIDAQLRSTTAWEGAKEELVGGFLPAITTVNNAFAETVGWLVRTKKAMDEFTGSVHDQIWGIDDSVVNMSDLEFHYMKLTQQANIANAALKDFSFADFIDVEDINNSMAVNEQMALFNEMMAETIALEAERNEVLEERVEAEEKVIEAVEEESDAQKKLNEIAESTAANFERLASNSISAMLSGADGAIMFGRILRTVVIDAISAVIAKLLVMKALSAFLGIFGGGGTSAAFSAFGAANPGEPNFIGPVESSAVASAGASAMSNAAMVDPSSIPDSSGRAVSVNMNIGRPVGILDILDLGEAAVTSARRVAEANL